MSHHRTLMMTVAGVAVVVATLIGCGADSGSPGLPGLPACSSATLLTVSPMANADIREITPLGNLNPPGHTFPTDHIYFYLASTTAPVVSPGNIRVSRVIQQTRSSGGTTLGIDYSIDFASCASVSLYFGHVATLEPAFAAKVGAIGGSCNAPYETGGFTYQQCTKNVDITMSPGEAIGTSVPGTGPTVLTFFPTQSGQVNLDFNRVTADGRIYCYHFSNSSTVTAYIQLETNSHLRIQVKPGGTCGDPATYSFGGTAVGFDR